MKLYFFTYVDKNPKYRRDAEILIASGKKYGRDIHLYEIPDGEMWNRYKVKLIASQLPDADRYICLDSDTVLTCRGDWESDDCRGTVDILYYMGVDERLRYTHSFIKNHTLLDGDKGAYEYIMSLWKELNYPIWRNSGVVVFDRQEKAFMSEQWLAWLEIVDSHCDAGYVVGDEAPLMFAAHAGRWPYLPPRFNVCLKWQPVPENAVLLHADGNVNGEKRIPFNKAVEKVLGESKK